MSTPFDADALGELYDRARRLEDAGDIEGAAALFHACLAMDPDDHCGVVMRLAGHGLAAPQTAPPAYVATLFEQHADAFDEILVTRLGYDVPALARRLVDAHPPPHPAPAGALRILDLGCGTGLAGVAFSDLSCHITGLDLAEGMLALADERGVYTDLYVGEAVAFMAGWDEVPFDLVIAADVWPYLGELEPFASAASHCLAAGGRLVASSERAAPGATFAVTPTQRFAHGTDYVRRVLGAAGFAIDATEPITVRHEEGVPVAGDLVLAQRATDGG
ncbi:MAG: class I SAM-dependent methyltransferase [Acuticoccus sp.]